MTALILVIHVLLAVVLVGVVLLQRSEGGALGIGGGAGMSGRASWTMLTRVTAFLAVCFFATSMGLALLERPPSSILEALPEVPASEGFATPAPAPIPEPEESEP